MSAKFKNLRFQRIIAHEIILASELEKGRTPQESDLFIELDPKGTDLLARRFSDSMGSESHSIALDVDISSEGSSFDLITRLLECKDREFIQATKAIALRLTKAQTAGTIKSGLALFVDGEMGGEKDRRRFIAVLKAESDSGFLKKITRKAVSLQFVADLVLGAQQRLYKMGCFVERSSVKSNVRPRAAGDFDVFVYDHLVSNTGDSQAARYFYSAFLGCKLAYDSSRLTRVFYERTSEFIDNLKLPTEKRVEAKTHLVSYLRSPQTTISTNDYADRYIQPELRDGYLKWVHKDANLPKRDIAKDNSQITHRLQIRRMLFTSSVRISAPANEFNDLVQVQDSNDGWTTVKINGDIRAQT
jgi:hypothetical protein